MKLVDAWSLSKIPYGEVVYKSIAEERGRMWWGAFGRSGLDKEVQDLELTKKALRIAKFDKLVVAVFNFIVSVIPFTSLFFGTSVGDLTSSISLSLTITFGFTLLYAIQTLSSFVSAESSALLSTLPIAQDDFSLITLFSFIRSVDYIVAGSILSQVILVAYLTASPLATLVMIAASIINSVFAVTVALWFSGIFYKNLMRGGRSKSNTALRLVYILMWGSLLIGVGFMLSAPQYVVPYLENILFSHNVLYQFFCLLYPFSAGIAIVNLVHPSLTISTTLRAYIALLGYAVLSLVAGHWSLGTVKRISKGTGVKIARVTAKDFSIKTHSPLLGYIMKDLRVASRNPATAFFFALPVLETMIFSLLTTNYGMIRASTMLIATFMGGIFALLMPLALLNAEGTGLEYTKTLPVSSQGIITAKTLISTATYVPVPLALLGIVFMKPLTSSNTILIPFFVTLTIVSASIFEIKLFLSYTKGRIAAITHDLEKMFIGVMTILIPEVAYAIVYLISLDSILAILTMSGTTFIELVIAVFLLKRS